MFWSMELTQVSKYHIVSDDWILKWVAESCLEKVRKITQVKSYFLLKFFSILLLNIFTFLQFTEDI